MIATDLAGQTSAESSAKEFELDTVNTMTATMDSGVQLNADETVVKISDQEWTNPERLTNDSTPRFSGQLEAGDSSIELVLFKDGSKVFADPIVIDGDAVQADGSWQYEIKSLLGDGEYRYELTSIDVSGNSKTIQGDFELNVAGNLLSATGLTDASDSEPAVAPEAAESTDNITNLDPVLEGFATSAVRVEVVLVSRTGGLCLLQRFIKILT